MIAKCQSIEALAWQGVVQIRGITIHAQTLIALYLEQKAILFQLIIIKTASCWQVVVDIHGIERHIAAFNCSQFVSRDLL